MSNIYKTIRALAQRTRSRKNSGRPSNTKSISHTHNGILLEFNNGRSQLITVSNDSIMYRLTSVILRRAEVEEIGRKNILPLIWLRNRATDLVAFTLDRKGRLVGRIEQPAQTADPDEVLYYLEHLAWESDRLEYLLRGADDL